MRDAEGRKKKAQITKSKKAVLCKVCCVKQHNTPKAVTFPKKNKLLNLSILNLRLSTYVLSHLPQMGFESTTLCTLENTLPAELLRQLSYSWAQILHLICT